MAQTNGSTSTVWLRIRTFCHNSIALICVLAYISLLFVGVYLILSSYTPATAKDAQTSLPPWIGTPHQWKTCLDCHRACNKTLTLDAYTTCTLNSPVCTWAAAVPLCPIDLFVSFATPSNESLRYDRCWKELQNVSHSNVSLLSTCDVFLPFRSLCAQCTSLTIQNKTTEHTTLQRLYNTFPAEWCESDGSTFVNGFCLETGRFTNRRTYAGFLTIGEQRSETVTCHFNKKEDCFWDVPMNFN